MIAPFLSYDVFHYLTDVAPRSSVIRVVKRSYKRVEKYYGQPNPTLFSWKFLHEEGAEIVNNYIQGKLVRHRAAEALAQTWNADSSTLSEQHSRYRIASTAMTADLFLMELTKELTSTNVATL
ncbi:MAG: hypothetical protein KDE54_15995 [Caldilineaceae bacterium]|nr:hypothetical protein [Caldilineaceae bacterium]MCB0140166.1 hypothetical protein [Caldilineaceae bacterium]